VVPIPRLFDQLEEAYCIGKELLTHQTGHLPRAKKSARILRPAGCPVNHRTASGPIKNIISPSTGLVWHGWRAILGRVRMESGPLTPRREIMPKTFQDSSPAGGRTQTAQSHPTREEIELRAYQIYLERAGAPGNELDDWTRAERELLAKYGKTSPIAKAKTA